MILVDTSCWIEYLHPQGDARVKERLSSEIAQGTVATCGPVLCELSRGASIGEAKRLRLVFSGLLNVPTLDQDWAKVQDLSIELKTGGLQPPILDMLVAVIAHRSSATLWHFGDRHFRMIEKKLRMKVDDLSHA